MTRYALERLLYRLSVSGKRDDFILKDVMLFAVWRDDPLRPTRDLDLRDAKRLGRMQRQLGLAMTLLVRNKRNGRRL